MNLDQKIIAEARSWIGTPFIHQERQKGIGCDCLGLLAGLIAACCIKTQCQDQRTYSRNPDGALRDELDRCLPRIIIRNRRPSHVLLFGFCTIPQHIGILTDENTFIHAYAKEKAVVETDLDNAWIRSIAGVYRLGWK